MSEAHYQREVEWYETLLTQKSKKIVELETEIERLRQVSENIQQARVLQGKAIIDARNEIESLRLALEVAANDLDDWGAYTKANNARAALEGE